MSQSKDKYVLIGNTLREEITHRTKYSVADQDKYICIGNNLREESFSWPIMSEAQFTIAKRNSDWGIYVLGGGIVTLGNRTKPEVEQI